MIHCRSEIMQRVVEVVAKVSMLDSNVLLTGESGVGKEVAAREIHRLSNRSGQPFFRVAASALPSSFVAHSCHRREACVEEGVEQEVGFCNGTLYFDEISDLNPDAQRDLAAMIRQKEYIDENPRGICYRLDVRILASTRRNLREEVLTGRFDPRLFQEVNFVRLEIPPLRERQDDIPILLETFTSKYAREYAKAIPRLGRDQMDVLIEYPWPGNVRELENFAKRIVAAGPQPRFFEQLVSKQLAREKGSVEWSGTKTVHQKYIF